MISTYSLNGYGQMIIDAIRTGSYREALRRAVNPGAVVLDIGTGTGIFAMWPANARPGFMHQQRSRPLGQELRQPMAT
jgi:protein arginine N-methyltransferase 1